MGQPTGPTRNHRYHLELCRDFSNMLLGYVTPERSSEDRRFLVLIRSESSMANGRHTCARACNAFRLRTVGFGETISQ